MIGTLRQRYHFVIEIAEQRVAGYGFIILVSGYGNIVNASVVRLLPIEPDEIHFWGDHRPLLLCAKHSTRDRGRRAMVEPLVFQTETLPKFAAPAASLARRNTDWRYRSPDKNGFGTAEYRLAIQIAG